MNATCKDMLTLLIFPSGTSQRLQILDLSQSTLIRHRNGTGFQNTPLTGNLASRFSHTHQDPPQALLAHYKILHSSVKYSCGFWISGIRENTHTVSGFIMYMPML